MMKLTRNRPPLAIHLVAIGRVQNLHASLVWGQSPERSNPSLHIHFP